MIPAKPGILTPEQENFEIMKLFDALFYIDPVINEQLGQAVPNAEFLQVGRLAYADGSSWNPSQGAKAVLMWDGTAWVAPCQVFGDLANGNFVEIESDGTIELHGDATVYLDELAPLIGSKIESPSSHIVASVSESAMEFKTSCDLNDYIALNFQFNHDRLLDSDIFPHLHWWQSSATIPNWLMQYRWQVNGQAKTTAWTSAKYATHAFTYTAGTLNQITSFGSISAPANDGVSTILQVRLLRDVANTSTLFSGTDGLGSSIYGVSFDIHKQLDGIGSRSEYTK